MSDDVTITKRENGGMTLHSFQYGHTPLAPVEVAALREFFAAERMPEDVQKLVDETREIAGKNHLGLKGVRDLGDFLDELADALEAAYSQKVEPEWEWGVRHHQGVNPCRSRSEAEAEVERFAARDERIQPAFRGRAALMRRRRAGEWEPVEKEAVDGPR